MLPEPSAISVYIPSSGRHYNAKEAEEHTRYVLEHIASNYAEYERDIKRAQSLFQIGSDEKSEERER
jgi:hypothetical protein